MMHTDYHPSADRFTRMLAAKGVRFVPDPENTGPVLVPAEQKREPKMIGAFSYGGKLSIKYGPADLPVQPMQAIKMEVAAKHGFTVCEMESARRNRKLVNARHEAMWRMHKETSASLPMIGKVLGGKDHTTILHGIRRYQARIDAGEV